MMRAVLALPVLLIACTPQSQRLSLSDAVDICTKRAIATGQKRFGPNAEEPPDSVVQDQYRACVYAYSGQYPAEPVAWRNPPPTRLQDTIR